MLILKFFLRTFLKNVFSIYFQRKPLPFKIKSRLSLLTGILECLLFSGATLGWTSLVYIYKLEGFFDELCPNATSHVKFSMHQNHTDCVSDSPILQKCSNQDEIFSQIYILTGSAINFGCLLTGFLMDRFGTRTG